MPEIVNGREGIVTTGGNDGGRVVIGQAFHKPHAQADGEMSILARRLKCAIPAARIDADRANLDTVVGSVADDLRRQVEAHGLGVEEGRAEDVGMVAFHPARGIGDEGEARRVRLRKTV